MRGRGHARFRFNEKPCGRSITSPPRGSVLLKASANLPLRLVERLGESPLGAAEFVDDQLGGEDVELFVVLGAQLGDDTGEDRPTKPALRGDGGVDQRLSNSAPVGRRGVELLLGLGLKLGLSAAPYDLVSHHV